MRRILSFLLSATFVAACGGSTLAPDALNGGDALDAGDAGDAPPGDDGSLGCDPSLTYASFGMAFFSKYCGNCHQWDQQAAQTSGFAIVNAAGTGMFMPPSDPRPTPQERQELTAWINCGAP